MNTPPRFGRFSLEQMIRSERAGLEKVVFDFFFGLFFLWRSGPDLLVFADPFPNDVTKEHFC